jgi:hypothetical protein
MAWKSGWICRRRKRESARKEYQEMRKIRFGLNARVSRTRLVAILLIRTLVRPAARSHGLDLVPTAENTE